MRKTRRPVRLERASAEDSDKLRLRANSLAGDEIFQFKGKEEPAKEFDCVLIYNEEDGVCSSLRADMLDR